MMHADLDSLLQLPLAEKLRVVEVLWEDIAASAEEFPLPDWLRTEVERRLAEHQSDPSATLTRGELWQQVTNTTEVE
jgi:putative addiction module component (TIGR02574 family)